MLKEKRSRDGKLIPRGNAFFCGKRNAYAPGRILIVRLFVDCNSCKAFGNFPQQFFRLRTTE